MSKRLEAIEKMLAAGSRDPFVWYAKAMELRSMGETRRALEAYGDVRREFPTYVPVYLMGGQVAVELGERETAREWLETGMGVARAVFDEKASGEMASLLATLG